MKYDCKIWYKEVAYNRGQTIVIDWRYNERRNSLKAEHFDWARRDWTFEHPQKYLDDNHEHPLVQVIELGKQSRITVCSV